MGGEQEKIRLEPSPTRCPYCHERVEAGGAEWVACRSCLGRHHVACWAESGRCAGCGLEEHLQAGEAEARRAGPGDHAELRRVLESAQAPGLGALEWLLSPVTAGLFPLLSAEARLRRHLQGNRSAFAEWERRRGADEAEDVERLATWRTEALGGAEQASRSRSLVFSSIFGVCLLMALVGLFLAVVIDDDLAIISVLSGWAWGVALLIGAALHHLSVARHEQRQLCHHLLARGATPEEARAALGAHARAWRFGEALHIFGGGAVGVASCGIALPFVYPLLALSPLRRHEQREAEVMHLGPPPK